MSGKRAVCRWASGALLAAAIGIAAAGCAVVPYDPYPYAYGPPPGVVVAPSVVVGGGYYHGGHGGHWHRGGWRHR